MQDRIIRCFCPPDIGRIPLKIESGFSHLTADPLKNWVLCFSIMTLRDIIIGDDMECWRHFVLACRILSPKQLKTTDANLADALLLQFCSRVERMYGKSFITPNLHLHAHLKECILDYGPLHGFWLFSFERYNGILGKISTNNRSIEYQFMRRFLEDSESVSFSHPEMYDHEFSPLFSTRPLHGSVSENTIGLEESLIDESSITFPNQYKRALFSSNEVDNLRQMYSKMYHVPANSIEIGYAFKKYTTISMKGKHIGCKSSRSKSSSIVVVHWNEHLRTWSQPYI